MRPSVRCAISSLHTTAFRSASHTARWFGDSVTGQEQPTLLVQAGIPARHPWERVPSERPKQRNTPPTAVDAAIRTSRLSVQGCVMDFRGEARPHLPHFPSVAEGSHFSAEREPRGGYSPRRPDSGATCDVASAGREWGIREGAESCFDTLERVSSCRRSAGIPGIRLRSAWRHGSSPGAHKCHCLAAAIGSLTVNRVSPGRDSTRMSPSWRLTIR
jgi:hypothetical protein